MALRRRSRFHCGCLLKSAWIFKNPPGLFAGKLLEECGLKGRRIGGAEISPVHANVIVNAGGATAKDVEALMEEMKSAVRTRFGIELEPEIKLLR